MKKFLIALLTILCLSGLPMPAHAMNARVQHSLTSAGRGVVNIPTSILEIGRAYKLEKRDRGYWWPISFTPRYLLLVTYRAVSGAIDLGIHPFFSLFVDEAPKPWTSAMGLPDYFWQEGEIDY